MGIKSIIGATCACLAVVSFNANAALVERLGGLAYYDDVANLTWLADANYAQTSGYDTDGKMTWVDANAWVAGLSVDGVDGWRLSNTPQPDPSCFQQAGGESKGHSCTGSDLGNLFYNVLGGTAGISIVSSHNVNYDLFSNVHSFSYWSATVYEPFAPDYAWDFAMNLGTQGADYGLNTYYAWAVQSGDVSAVPVPAAVWLFGSGLIGLVGTARHKKA